MASSLRPLAQQCPALRCHIPRALPRTTGSITAHAIRPHDRTPCQLRWARVHDVRLLATTAPRRSILDKYKEKLDAKAKLEGHKSIEDLREAYSEKIDAQRKKDAIPGIRLDESGQVIPEIPGARETTAQTADSDSVTTASSPRPDSPSSESASSDTASASTSSGSSTKPEAAIRTLDDIINLEKVRDLPETELTALWRLRHASSPQQLCAVIPAATYHAMEDAARRVAPQFVLPVPHEGQGAEIHFLQWTFDAPSRTSTVLFTHLAEFKNRGEFAQPHTTVTHHLDLADDRGLVLMQGQVMDGRGVKPEQARWLLLCLQRFYGGWEVSGGGQSVEAQERAEERRNLLEWFSQGDSRFTVEKLMLEAERMG